MARHRLESVLLCLSALAGAGPALAGDISLRLDTGSGFSIRNGTGLIERLRVDEATGNVTRNGSLFVHTTGNNNLFVGAGAGDLATSGGGFNTAFGIASLSDITTGTDNAAVGNFSLQLNTTGSSNAAVGFEALRSNVSGNVNAAFGSQALELNTTGAQNAGFGNNALQDNQTGSGNAAFGSAALSNCTGSRNVALGLSAGNAQTSGNDNIYIDHVGVAAESGQIRVGTSGTHVRTFVAGIRGVTTANANAIPVLIDSAGQLGTVSSSREVKTEIRDMGDATARLLELRPVTFRYREQQQTTPGGGEAPPEYGLVAEEVAEVLPDLVVYDETGKPFTVKYHVMAPMLLNEMQRQRRAHDLEMAALTARLSRLEAGLHEAAPAAPSGW
jgi:hypothetical protein